MGWTNGQQQQQQQIVLPLVPSSLLFPSPSPSPFVSRASISQSHHGRGLDDRPQPH